jgi:hypothetical protein
MNDEELQAARTLIELARGVAWLLNSMGQDARTIKEAAELVEQYLDT